MADQELELPDGRTLVIPDNISLDQRAALRNKLGAQYADIKTGQGMEQRAQQQAGQTFTGTGESGNYDATGRKVSGPKGEPLTLMERAAQGQADRETTLGARMNRAARSPTPLTNASMAYFPAASARSIVGGKVGGEIGKRYGPYGELAGNVIGGVTAGAGPSIASRVGRMKLEVPEKVNLPGGFKVTTGGAPAPEPPPEPSPVVGTPSTGAAPPTSSPYSKLPVAPTTPQPPMTLGARTAARMPAEGANLTRRIITPGEEIDPLARSSAGSAAQATEGDLRRLAQAGDRSAQMELIRRRLPLGDEGAIDYSKAPMPSIGESRRRGAPGESPTTKSIRRHYDKVRKNE